MNGRTDIYTISGTPGKSARPIACDKHALQQGLGFRWPCQDLDLKAVSAGIFKGLCGSGRLAESGSQTNVIW